MITFLGMREQLKSRQFNALCLYGNDDWVKRKGVANVCEAYGIVDDGFSVDRLDNPTVEDIRLSCLTPSMFCAKKLVLCENFAMPDSGAKLNDVKRQLTELIKMGDGSFCLVIVADTDKNLATVEGLEMVCCNRLDKESVIKWIIAFCKRSNVEVDRLSADRLATYCLLDMSRVAVETQKLIDYGSVSIEAIDALVHKDAEYAVYDLSGAIADKNAQRALEIFRGLIARGEDARALFALLYNFYRRVYYVKTSSFNSDELAEFLGVKVGAVNFAKETANRYKPMQLKRALDCLARADAQLKAFVDEYEVMNLLIMQLVALGN